MKNNECEKHGRKRRRDEEVIRKSNLRREVQILGERIEEREAIQLRFVI